MGHILRHLLTTTTSFATLAKQGYAQSSASLKASASTQASVITSGWPDLNLNHDINLNLSNISSVSETPDNLGQTVISLADAGLDTAYASVPLLLSDVDDVVGGALGIASVATRGLVDGLLNLTLGTVSDVVTSLDPITVSYCHAFLV
jgi:hypothetical protein